MVVFNIYAFLQALILALILGVFYLVGFDSFFEGHGFWQLYFIHFVVAFTYRAGLKGRLFWIVPTWLITVVLLLFLNIDFHNDGMNPMWFNCLKFFNIAFPLYLAYRMIFGLDADFVKEFRKAQLVLQNINTTEEYFQNNKKEFWILISHTFVVPNRLYLHSYWLHKLIFNASVPQTEFVEHYLTLIHLIRDRLSVASNKTELLRFDYNLSQFKQNGTYTHENDSLKKLAAAIDLEVKAVS